MPAELTLALELAARAQLAGRMRRVHQLRNRLEACDLGRRFAALSTRLVGADGRLAAAMAGRRHRCEVRLGDSVGRLESLSPLSVLARGYAVCWNADRTAVIRDARMTTAGETVQVKLARGSLECDVRSTTDS
jgi:exodeoxyribonuclease VII large subunit